MVQGVWSVALSTWDTNNYASLKRGDSPLSPPDRTSNSDYELQGPIRQRQKRLTDAEVATMAARYDEGATVYELSAEFRCNRQTVAERLKKTGVILRFNSPTPTEVASMLRLRQEGHTFPAISEKTGFSLNTVRAHARSALRSTN